MTDYDPDDPIRDEGAHLGMSRWGADYWQDTVERAGFTLVTGVIAMLTADASGAVSGDPDQWWLLVGLPTALVLLKALAANLAGGGAGPTASIVRTGSRKNAG